MFIVENSAWRLMKENYQIYLSYQFHWRLHSALWDPQLANKKMKTMFLSNMSKSRRLTSTFFPIMKEREAAELLLQAMTKVVQFSKNRSYLKVEGKTDIIGQSENPPNKKSSVPGFSPRSGNLKGSIRVCNCRVRLTQLTFYFGILQFYLSFNLKIFFLSQSLKIWTF